LTPWWCCPGGIVRGGGATTVGVNMLPPLGLRPFSVGDAGALLAGVLVVVVVVPDGASFPPLPHAVMSELVATSTAAPATTTARRPPRPEVIMHLPVYERRSLAVSRLLPAWDASPTTE
jgi:hypothetical protein